VKYKIGLGYDIHKLEKNIPLYLGGRRIKSQLGLKGHSDGDVILHAISDAILGALGKGDIGKYFPPTDKKIKGIRSTKIIEKVLKIMRSQKFKIENLDLVVITNYVKLIEIKELLRESLSKILKVKKEVINIKGKTNQGIGLVGKSKAIACFCTVLLKNA